MNGAASRSQRTNARNQSGFTLIELLIVIAIISILAMVATPTYLAFALRAKISGDIPMIEPLKQLVTEFYVIENQWPQDNATAYGLPPEEYSGKYVQSVSVSSTPTPGSLTVVYDNTEINILNQNNTLIFQPQIDATTNAVVWVCEGGTIDKRYRPSECR